MPRPSCKKSKRTNFKMRDDYKYKCKKIITKHDWVYPVSKDESRLMIWLKLPTKSTKYFHWQWTLNIIIVYFFHFPFNLAIQIYLFIKICYKQHQKAKSLIRCLSRYLTPPPSRISHQSSGLWWRAIISTQT